ncbi:MAG: hypothetical protein CVV13_05515 [Gammaproteobacteria bacterium HGW-Gammaproteobacteria-3]|nr:MAG: hypothetical protein CVV13_05515 [Gammaproteobacteria bacterium HGW-Gammaproteobacteria-3]
MITFRYAPLVTLVLILALIPTVIHSYLGLVAADGRQVKNIPTELVGAHARATQRSSNWGEDTFNCFDWFERIYHDPQGNAARLFVGRSYDHKSLYHHPELTLSYGNDFNLKQRVLLAGSPEIPLKLLSHKAKPGIAAYALLSEDQFIDDPIRHQIKSSLKALIKPRQALTLFYVAQANVDQATSFDQTLAARTLRQAIAEFRKQTD